MIHLLIPLADIGSAVTGIVKLAVGYLGPILALVLAVAGFIYMFALEDHNKAMQAKRAVWSAVGGAILVAVALTLAATLVKIIGN